MSPAAFGAFLAVAAVVVLVPGPDLAVVTRNTPMGGRRPGWATSVGVPAHLAGMVAVMDRASGWLRRRRVRRALDIATGAALGACSIRLATDH